MTEQLNIDSDKKKVLYGLLLVVLIGFLTSKASFIAALWGILVFFYGLYLTVKTRNRNGVAHLFAAYLMASEVFFRMSWAGLPWEFSKYAIMVLLGLALIIDKLDRKLPMLMFVFFILLLPAVILSFDYFVDLILIKKIVFFNLLGVFVLIISTFYFYNLKLSMENFKNISRAIVFGILTMAILVLANVGDYSAIEFTLSSNSDSSGGFSGNQISIMFGIGFLIITINTLLKNILFIYKFLDIFLIMLFIFQGLMTFSRGGMLTAFIALFLGMLIYYFSNFNLFILFLKKSFLKILIFLLIMTSVASVVDDMTGGNLYIRYFNVNSSGEQVKEDITTGRGDITKGDLILFKESDYLGVGVGVSARERSTLKGFAAHVEYTRLLAEHGILGLVIICILFLMPLMQFLKLLNSPINNMILVSFSAVALLSMTHAATRVGAIGFLFGLAFILIVKENNEKQ